MTRERNTGRRQDARKERTRRRIVEAAVELHGTVGMARTTISAIAEKAGVQRLTVYRHFPDERAILSACSSHYEAQNPPPDPDPWTRIPDPEERLRRALGAVYAFYGRHERLLANLAADAHVNPTVREAAEPYYRHWEMMRDVLAAAWEVGDGQQRHVPGAALDLALDFQTWNTLVRQGGIGDERAVELMVGTMRCAMMGD